MSQEENKSPLVSVIIPCFNLGRFLGETLESVLTQTYSNWECIMVDNSSTDNTKDVANDFIKKSSRFKFYSQPNLGVSSARNAAIKKSFGKYILPLDSDDKIGKNYLSSAVNVLEQDSRVSIVYSEAELFGESMGKWNLPDFTMKQMLVENLIFCSALYSRSDYDKTSGYDESMLTGLEDWDFWLKILMLNGKVIKLPEVNFYYRIRQNSRNHSMDIEIQKNIRRKIYSNHIDLYQKYISVPDLIYESYLDKVAMKSISHSKDYQSGKLLMSPLRFIKSFFKRNK